MIVSCDADLTDNYMYISMKFRTGVHVFCWEVGVFNRSCFQSVSCKLLSSVTAQGWVVFKIHVAFKIFNSHCDLEEGDTRYLATANLHKNIFFYFIWYL